MVFLLTLHTLYHHLDIRDVNLTNVSKSGPAVRIHSQENVVPME